MEASKNQKTINLALQGGGAHGAFAWGVIDKMLEDGRINIEGICATSAGTMNGCALAYGLHLGGNEKAREVLDNLWWNISNAGKLFSPVKRMPWEKYLPVNISDSISYFIFDALTRIFSPYQFNPFDINPLREIMDASIDFEELQNCECVKLFLSATHVCSGKVRIFKAEETTLDVAMASACLPFLFKAVEVDGEEYWDGGYLGNPSLFPLFYETDTRDVLIVHINPIERHETPKDAHAIMNRVNEISFNSSLLQDLRAVAFVKKLLEKNMLKEPYKDFFTDVLVHSIRADEIMKDLSVASKFATNWDFLISLKDAGRKIMEKWLEENFKSIGKRDTVDITEEFLNPNNKII